MGVCLEPCALDIYGQLNQQVVDVQQLLTYTDSAGQLVVTFECYLTADTQSYK